MKTLEKEDIKQIFFCELIIMIFDYIPAMNGFFALIRTIATMYGYIAYFLCLKKIKKLHSGFNFSFYGVSICFVLYCTALISNNISSLNRFASYLSYLLNIISILVSYSVLKTIVSLFKENDKFGKITLKLFSISFVFNGLSYIFSYITNKTVVLIYIISFTIITLSSNFMYLYFLYKNSKGVSK